MIFLVAVAFKSFRLFVQIANSKLFGYKCFALAKSICGLCPHPRPLKRSTKLLYLLGKTIFKTIIHYCCPNI